MIRHLALTVWLVLAWFAFWRDISLANLFGGLAVAALVQLLFPLADSAHRLRLSPIGAGRFVLSFAASVIRSSLVVAARVIRPNNRVSSGIVAVEIASDHPVVVTIISHAIGLAPGTMVVDIDTEPTVLYVHVLHLGDPETIRAEVAELEQLVVAALKPASVSS